ncbi:MAG: long-chain fatty acid--CoA ligase [Desulfobulbaceae bacterium]|nr:long-chain fatty acid--CoA ligase [Desulfobulbaceae bacterium]
MKSAIDYIPPNSCKSLPGLFLARAVKSPNDTAYGYFDKLTSQWRHITWHEMLQKICLWRTALKNENLQTGDRVALMLGNSPDWVAYEQAALSLGLLVVPLYSNDRPDNISYILQDTESKILLCPGATYWQQLLPALNTVASLQRIVTIDDCQTQQDDPRLQCIDEWLPKEAAQGSHYSPTISETATIVYTSGTTGPPKGVMLSHHNILENCYAGLQCMDIYSSDVFLSFLPLSHMLERTAGYYLPMMAGACVTFSRSIPDLAEDLLTIQPTILIAVPRIFERVYSGIKATLRSKPPAAKKLFHWAVTIGWNSFLNKQGRGKWSPSLLSHPLLDRLVGKKIRDRLGGNLRIVIAGGAALSTDIAQFFIGLGLPIYQGYGLTETSPVISVNRSEDNRPGGVGPTLPGITVQLGEYNELLVKGHCVMQGYWNNEQATLNTIDKDGWLHTGDQAELQDGHIYITGRLKEILVLSNGEKVAPTDLEMAISLDPLFESNMVIGEARPYLSLICVLNTPLWEELAEQLQVPPAVESLQLQQVHQAVLKRVEKLLETFPGFVFIKNVSLSLAPWTVEQGLLTPTLKMKRKVIENHLKSDIDNMYKGE